MFYYTFLPANLTYFSLRKIAERSRQRCFVFWHVSYKTSELDNLSVEIRTRRNTISGNNIGSKGHWREPDSEMGTKLYRKYLSDLMFRSELSRDMTKPTKTWRMPRLIRVFAGRTITLLVLSCRGSIHFFFDPDRLDYSVLACKVKDQNSLTLFNSF